MNATQLLTPTDFLPSHTHPPSPPCIRKPNAHNASSHSSPSRTVLFFDWDDTLLASSVLNQASINLQTPDHVIPAALKTQFYELSQQVCALFRTLAQFKDATVFIITNAETGWVELSARKFMPEVLPYLSQFSILSARSTYERQFPDNPNQWKLRAFTEKVRLQFPPSADMHIVSFGDSECERNACLAMSRMFSKARTKSVKFMERPSIDQVRRQLEMITHNFSLLMNHEGNLDLMLTLASK
eukprot:gnl/Trimastix_PCT/823.p1 GENE.gnl/Trimastix_PCT/823~~gnl/Trimastix_PCT/823.p1  ORF type:complete len:242 (-),score=31.62 gnl/Trimastix_PCT/823:442-1167(-)